MKYEKFDKLIGRGSANQVMLLLKQEAWDIDALGKKLDLDRTSVFYHIKNLIKKKLVEKKMVGKRAYYGLINEYRPSPKQNKVNNND